MPNSKGASSVPKFDITRSCVGPVVILKKIIIKNFLDGSEKGRIRNWLLDWIKYLVFKMTKLII